MDAKQEIRTPDPCRMLVVLMQFTQTALLSTLASCKINPKLPTNLNE